MSGEATCGAFLQINSHISAEILSQAGFDWLIVDMEHAPVDLDSLLHQLQAMGNSGNCVPFVRSPWNDAVAIKRILDAGALGIVIPYVNTKAQAEAAVSACKFPPDGTRGAAMSPRAARYGSMSSEYFAKANEETVVIVSVETKDAIQNLDEILSVPGIDGIFIGPMDLAVSLGHNDVQCEPVRAAIAEIENKVLKSDKFLGTIATDWNKAKACYERGYQWLILMQDGLALASMADTVVRRFRGEVPGN
ncbi:MAG: aldolase/citrate lyase family protein [Woeseiaceae bacterium]|nr:aldolase/citrate lyase family protein [Woeseiaceae bacterium]